jgi:glycosyltransferase involved in cell wall biosynthesis
VVSSIPRFIAGIDNVQVLVVSDGSRDRTAEKALEAGADSVLEFKKSQGLAKVYKTAVGEALRMGADVIVNIDADGQYVANEMPSLVAPIVNGKADVVLGSRFAGRIEEMPRSKKVGNRFGTWVVKRMSGIPITDAHTGYRAISRHAALSMNVMSSYTYTQETILQAAYKKLQVLEVPVTFNRRADGSSRLVRSFFSYGRKAAFTVGKMFGSQHALGYMMMAGALAMLVGIGLGARVLVHFGLTGNVSPLLPSAIMAGFAFVFGLQLIALGLIAALTADNRALIEDALYVIKDRRS